MAARTARLAGAMALTAAILVQVAPSGLAGAAAAVVDFDDLPAGTTIQAQHPGVTFLTGTTGTGGDGVLPVVTSDPNASSGTNVGSIRQPGCGGEFCANMAIARFDELQGQVSVEVGSTGSTSEVAVVQVQALQLDGTTPVAGAGATASIPVAGGAAFQHATVTGSDIAFVVVRGPLGRHIAIDDLTFEVPDAPGSTSSTSSTLPGASSSSSTSTTRPPSGSRTCALLRDGAAGPLSVGVGGSIDVPLIVRRTPAVTGALTVREVGRSDGLRATVGPATATSGTDARVVATITADAATAATGGEILLEASTTDGAVRCRIALDAEIRSGAPRVTGVEVTQGVQQVALPTKGGDPAAPVPYRGVQLAAEGRTVVRVFANLAGGPAEGIAGIGATLTGFAAGSTEPLPGSPLRPEWGTRRLVPGGPATAPEERVDPNGAFTFTLPPSWTTGTISLRAELETAGGPFAGVDTCADPSCTAQRSFTLTGIRFRETATLHFMPVELFARPADAPGTSLPAPDATCYRRQSWSGGRTIMSDPYTCDHAGVFAETRNLMPAGERNLPAGGSWWAGIDISAVQGITQAELDASIPWVAPGTFNEARVRGSYAAGRLSAWAERLELFDDTDGWDVQRSPLVVGAYPEGFNIRAVTTYRCTGGWFDGCDNWPVAVVQGTARPLSSVGHEIHHMMGRAHASGCNRAGSPASWPPDQRGFIQGVGLDRRAGSGGLVGPYAIKASASDFPTVPKLPQWYDLMSYCASNDNDPDSWISARYWNDTIDTLATDSAEVEPAVLRGATSDDGPSIQIDGIAEGGAVLLTRVAPVDGPAGSAPDDGAYRVVARDADGEVRHDVAMSVREDHTDDGGTATFVHARVPAAGVAAIEVTHEGEVVATRSRAAAPPTVEITDLEEGDVVGEGPTTTFSWEHTVGKAPDGDGPSLPGVDRVTTAIDLSRDGGATWQPLALAGDQRSITVRSEILPSSDTARIRVTVEDGFDAAEAISEPFGIVGRAPAVTIAEPVAGARFADGATVVLDGSAYDDDHAAIGDADLVWAVGDRELGSGRSLAVTDLEPGVQVLTLTATDADGRAGSAAVCIEVVDEPTVAPSEAPVACPEIEIVEPEAMDELVDEQAAPDADRPPGDDDGDGSAALLLVGGGALAVAVLVLLARRRRSSGGAPEPQDDAPPT